MGRVDAHRLVEPSFNLRLGTAYLQQMHSRFNGSAVLASAAYNAGPSRSQLWQSSIDRQVPGAAFAESIPFTETRDYVKQVLANTVMYETMLALGQTPSQPAQLDDASSQRLSAWLSHIEPSSHSSSSR
jgi:soluble lytic murein transglycosylase